MRILIFFILSWSCAFAQSLDVLLKEQTLWETPKQGFLENHREFRWLSADVAQSKTGTVFSLPSVLSSARFEAEKLSQLEVLLYSRGDMGDRSKEQFQDLLRKVVEALSAHTGMRAKPLGKDPTSAVKAEMVEWQTPLSRYLLEYSFTKEVKTKEIPFRAEFMRLVITPTLKPLPFGGVAQKKKFSGAEHLKREPSGDVVLTGIPMVDQGDKGYCVVASAERVLRFYGGDVDLNELAQVANSSATEGTNVEAMLDSLQKLSNRLRIRVRTLEELDVRRLLDLVEDYNRAARREKAQRIVVEGATLDIGTIYKQMRPELLVQVKTKSTAGMNGFMRDVQRQIDKGYPLLWSVRLGIVPEGKHVAQMISGHMRLITGYNTKTNEILYSDSWGAGHELKRHALPNAWAITTSLHAIEPL